MKKRVYLIVILLVNIVFQAHAVLKEKDLNSTLVILRKELMDKHDELEKRNKYTQIRNERTMEQFRETFHRSNQNSLMLYSQKPDYVFDLTYACHEATDQFQQFTRHSAPLRKYMEKNNAEIARYDSLIGSLEKMMRYTQMDERARVDCNVCLTLATNIRKSMSEAQEAMQEYNRLYAFTEQRLRNPKRRRKLLLNPGITTTEHHGNSRDCERQISTNGTL